MHTLIKNMQLFYWIALFSQSDLHYALSFFDNLSNDNNAEKIFEFLFIFDFVINCILFILIIIFISCFLKISFLRKIKNVNKIIHYFIRILCFQIIFREFIWNCLTSFYYNCTLWKNCIYRHWIFQFLRMIKHVIEYTKF